MYVPRHKPPRRYAQLGNDVPVPFLSVNVVAMSANLTPNASKWMQEVPNRLTIQMRFDCCLGVAFQLIFSWFCCGIHHKKSLCGDGDGRNGISACHLRKVRNDPPMRRPPGIFLFTFSQPSKKQINRFSKILASLFSEKSWLLNSKLDLLGDTIRGPLWRNNAPVDVMMIIP